MDKAKIFYHDIGDYLGREEKLAIVKKYGSVTNVPWEILTPNEHGDWLNKRNNVFGTFIPIGDKDDYSSKAFFNPLYSRGLASARDSWCYNSSRKELIKNIRITTDFYNAQREAFNIAKRKDPSILADDFISYDSSKISWNRGFKQDLERGKIFSFENKSVMLGLYRPFFKQHAYFSRELNDMVYLMPKLFPNSETKNLVICVSGLGGSKENSALITNYIPDLNCLDSGSQCFPLYYYEERPKQQRSLFDTDDGEDYIRRDGVSDFILAQARKAYGNRITKEDIFYYVYGFLHSVGYRQRFANDLKKMLPRIPLVDEAKDFWAFSKAGRRLADLHINYEKVVPCQTCQVSENLTGLKSPFDYYRVEKMRFPQKDQKDTIIYNGHITIANIPAEAYEYIVNGKSAIEWIMERYQVTTHKESGIRNDPNDWATEVVNPRYILDLLLSVINVSVQTVEIVKGLPELGLE